MNTKETLIRSLGEIGGARLDKIRGRIFHCRKMVMGVGPGGTLRPRLLRPCNFKLCPETRRRKGGNIVEEYGDVLGKMTAPKHLSCSVENVQVLTRETVTTFKRSIEGLIGVLRAKRGCRGGLVSYEAKYGLTGWHFHAHLIVDVDYVPMRFLKKAWEFESAGRDIFIKETWWKKDMPNPKGVCGLVTYIFKETFEFDYGQPELVRQFLEATVRLRLHETFGSVRKGRIKRKKRKENAPPTVISSPEAAQRDLDDLLARIEKMRKPPEDKGDSV